MTAGPKILLVDDEERFRQTLAKRLQFDGYEVGACAGGREALAELQIQPYDIVILDLRMPGMDGLTALQEIKKLAPEVEVIMLTGHASVDVAVEIMQAGGAEYLLKPVSTEELCLKIDACWERQRVRRKRQPVSGDSQTG